jgi:hypothetical protein
MGRLSEKNSTARFRSFATVSVPLSGFIGFQQRQECVLLSRLATPARCQLVIAPSANRGQIVAWPPGVRRYRFGSRRHIPHVPKLFATALH